MNKNEIMEMLQIVANVLIMVSGGYVMKAKRVIDNYEHLEKKVNTLENSLKASWEKIDKLKKLPHGGEI